MTMPAKWGYLRVLGEIYLSRWRGSTVYGIQLEAYWCELVWTGLNWRELEYCG